MNKIELNYLYRDATFPVDVENCEHKLIVHICNDIGAWGSGFVLAVSSRWLEPEHEYRNKYDNLNLGDIQIVNVEDDIAVVNMLAQHGIIGVGNRHPINYSALQNCLKKVANYALDNNCSVHMPKIGTARAGGEWELIEQIIKEELVCKNIPTYVYIWK